MKVVNMFKGERKCSDARVCNIPEFNRKGDGSTMT